MAPSHKHVDQVLVDLSVGKQDLEDLVAEDHTPGQNGQIRPNNGKVLA